YTYGVNVGDTFTYVIKKAYSKVAASGGGQSLSVSYDGIEFPNDQTLEEGDKYTLEIKGFGEDIYGKFTNVTWSYDSLTYDDSLYSNYVWNYDSMYISDDGIDLDDEFTSIDSDIFLESAVTFASSTWWDDLEGNVTESLDEVKSALESFESEYDDLNVGFDVEFETNDEEFGFVISMDMDMKETDEGTTMDINMDMDMRIVYDKSTGILLGIVQKLDMDMKTT
ncbi:MAG: hypothetical protein ACFFDT_35805, partial [Candidatus Hodarchaeota archaeon]